MASFDLKDDSVFNCDADEGSSAEQEESDELQKSHEQETQRVKWGKKIVYLMMTVAAGVTASMTYLFLKRQEEDTMVVSFNAYSREILKQAQANVAHMFQELEDLAKDITSHALANNLKWPNVTVPHFNVRAQDNTVEFVGFAPFVTPDVREGWEAYAVANQDWIQEEFNYQSWSDKAPEPIPPRIHHFNTSAFVNVTELYEDPQFQYEIPLWQVAPPREDLSMINLDLASVPILGHLLWDVRVKKVEQFGRIMDLRQLMAKPDLDNAPRGTIYKPVFRDFTEASDVTGMMLGVLSWNKIFTDVLFESSKPLLVEIEGTCNSLFTYLVTGGKDIEFLGYGQGHRDTKFDKYKQTAALLEPKNSRPGYPPVNHTHRTTDASHPTSHCTYVMNTYPTSDFVEDHESSEPLIFALMVLAVVFFTSLSFTMYDRFNEHRQRKLMTTAKSTNAILSSMFPKDVQIRIMEEARKEAELQAQKSNRNTMMMGKTSRMTEFLNNGDRNDQAQSNGKPIADLFPSATVMFADIVGFTAWSSTREPCQVFQLLETLYSSFDKIAKRRKVFKVETIGDCYVAVCGLPEKAPKHPVIMAKFARDCLERMHDQLMFLETSLGPDTASLGMRIGLHSGSVTAGVLRGDRARFQLFGDTVNTCSRIETTGLKDRIHCSEQFVNLLIAAGKEQWVQKREEKVQAKGKGELQTYWLKCGSDDTASTTNHDQTESDDDEDVRNAAKDLRLIEWNVDVLGRVLRQIQAKRGTVGKSIGTSNAILQLEQHYKSRKHSFLNEVQDVLSILGDSSNGTHLDYVKQAEELTLPKEVEAELRQYVAGIAAMYNRHAFHSFEHASHVTMSTCKLLSRVIEEKDSPSHTAHQLPSRIIKEDPLTQFALVLSAIIHDADHPGCSNAALVKENNPLTSVYNRQSVAEQNSVALAWNLLMEDDFKNLRAAIYSTEAELERFRAVVVNAVMATDVMDKELGAARNARWEKAFDPATALQNPEENRNRKATIVIEHLIQASDVAHTMQHWHIYKKWNERLYQETAKAYREGRAERNPAEIWYEGELGFFDFYVIPLAKKLSDCGVFGVSSDEYLGYAMANRQEWEAKGRAVVAEYVKKFESA